MMSVSVYCLHTGSQHGDDHTGALLESNVTGSADMTLTREDVASGGDNRRKCSSEISAKNTGAVSEVGQSTTVVLVYTAIIQFTLFQYFRWCAGSGE